MSQPISFAYRNLVFGASLEDAWALFRLDTVSYDGRSESDKRELLGLLAACAYSLEADFSLLRVSRSWSVGRYRAGAEAIVDPQHAHPGEWTRHLHRHESALAARETWRPEVFLAVRLAPPDAPAVQQAAQGLARAVARLRELAGRGGIARDARGIRRSQLEALARMQETIFRRVADYLDVEPASTAELEWLVRRALCRGLGEPDCDPGFEPQALILDDEGDEWRYVPLELDVLRLFECPLWQPTRAGGWVPEPYLVASSEHGASYQTFLALGALPEAVPFPSRQAELLFAPLEALDFRVDACLSARFVPNAQAVALVRKRIVDADNTYVEESHGDHGPSAASSERPHTARELEEHLTSAARPPLLRSSITLAVAADSRQRLEERVERVRREYGPVRLHRPAADQLPLFVSQLPAQRSAVSAYDDYLTIEQFGALVPIATHAVGSEAGFYIGHTLSGSAQPVLFDPTEASRTSRPPSVLLAGTLGSGKTLFMQLLEYQAFLAGSRIVDVDPKGGGDHRLAELPGMDGHVERIELSSDDAYRGMLDPLRIALPELREDLAVSFLFDLLPGPLAPGWKREIIAAVRAVTRDAADRGRDAGCGQVIERLCADAGDDARAAGETLAVYADTGLARLGFGAGRAGPLAAGDRQVTMLGIRNLARPLPGTPKADYTEEERIGQALLRLLAAYAMRLVAHDPGRHAIAGFDEAHFLLSDSAGRRLIEVLNRMGRSLNVTPILATQTLAETAELDNLLGVRCMFGMESEREAATALELLGLDGSDQRLRATLTSYRRGRCLMRDYAGRVGRVQIDLLDPQLLATLDTTPRAPDADGADAALRLPV
ncbi:MAG TPA: ATP-binding protein [Thermoleophilaceae bacterium]